MYYKAMWHNTELEEKNYESKGKGLPVTRHAGKGKSRGISLFILNLCARLGGHCRFSPGKEPQ